MNHVSKGNTRTQACVMKCNDRGFELIREVKEGFLEVVTQAEIEGRMG